LRPIRYIFIACILFFYTSKHYAQHYSKINATANLDKKTVEIVQEITYFNASADSLETIILNDWNHAFSEKNTPLAKRFSDEFYRGFHLAQTFERGGTDHLNIFDTNGKALFWERKIKSPDLLLLKLDEKLAPNQKIVLNLSYTAKIPSDKFTKYGFTNLGGMSLKNWFLSPALYENHAFVTYNNDNLDDVANAVCNFDIDLKVPKNIQVTTDLSTLTFENEDAVTYKMEGENRTDFSLFLEKKSSFISFQNNNTSIVTNLRTKNVSDIEKAILINKIADFTTDFIGKYPHDKIVISQTCYDRNPFYGLNQLPSFLTPFDSKFIFEIQFLKTYLYEYLKTTLNLDSRKNNWIYDGIQMYAMMEYMNQYHPDAKMFGSIAKYKILKSFHLIDLDFNEQYSYFYMLMARKNLDQPLSFPKNALLKFNEQIANKYRAGLSFEYLNSYLKNDFMKQSIQEFYALNQKKQTSRTDFETILKSKTPQNINWFFETIVDSRKIIDYKLATVSKTKDSVTFSIQNKTNTAVPIPVYGLQKGAVVFKKWITQVGIDSTFTLDRKNADKIVLNYNNEVPEFNLRNNWKSLKSFYFTNKPIKFTFLRDLEDPKYNQIFYVPSLTYNLYDGFTPGIQLHNDALLNRPFNFDINPSYSLNTKTITGGLGFSVNQYYRNSNLYNVKYSFSGSYFHYAPDANYLRINPSVILRIRESNFRDNRKQAFVFREVIVDREKSAFINTLNTENYAVFNAKYYNTKTEVTNHVNFNTDLQISGKFGKIAAEMEYRKLFENNRQINLRLYVGHFLYNKNTSDFFSFALDRPSDYLFDYSYLGRSETTGIFSQEFVLAEGGFKSKIANPYANQFIVALNGGYSVWNWVEVYGDLGVLKNTTQTAKLAYDSGIKLNFVPDYFELYFPFYSNNGWEIAQNKYSEKIRFKVTLSPQTLLNLFTRKWF
jgi:hypothetical protein